MVNALSRWWVWAVLLAWGCSMEEASEVDPETPDTGRVVTDGSLSPDMGPQADAGEVLPDAMMRGDGALDVDAEPSDAAPPDMMMASDAFVPVEIGSCEEACGRFEDCERIARDWGSLEACLTALRALDEADAFLYYDVLFARLNTAAKEVLDTMLNKHGYEFQSDFALKHRAEGQLISLRRMLRKQAQLKFGGLSNEHNERIEQAAMSQLEIWVEDILTAETADALFQ